MDKLNLVYTHLDTSTRVAVSWPNGVELNDVEGFIALRNRHNVLGNRPGEKINLFDIVYKGKTQGYLNILSVNEIPDNERYVFPIEVVDQIRYWSHYLNKPLCIPEQVEKDVIAGKAKILFIVPFEGSSIFQNEQITFLRQQKLKYNNNIVYSDSNMLVEEALSRENIKGIYHNPWVNTNNNIIIKQYINELKESIINKHIRPSKFMCFNRMPRPARAYMVNRMIELNLVKNNIVTFQMSERILKAGYGWDYYANVYSYKNLDLLKKNAPLVYDYEDVFKVNPTDIHIQPHKDSYFNIVNETIFYNKPPSMFFSEKIFKPILCMQPFVLAGATNSLKYLKQIGFKTFNNFIDESYDDIIDDNKRLDKIIEVIQFINNKTSEELSEILYQMYPILVHNHNHHMVVAEQEIGLKNLASRILNEW